MAKIPKVKVDFAPLIAKIKAQFAGIDANDPPSWPALPQFLLCLAVTAVVITVLWFAWLTSSADELVAEQAKEVELREEFQKKVAQAAVLEALKKQREEVQQYVLQLEKQLPSKSEMDALLSDINQAGLGRSLQFELFKPGQVVVRDYYAELPIGLRVTGRYHDIGSFAADIANLSRIVTLNDLALSAGKEGQLTLDSIAKTFRYLDADEVAMQRKAAAEAKGGKKMTPLHRVLRLLLLSVIVGLTACGTSEHEELQSWMTEQRNAARPTAPPISPPTKFSPQPYTEANAVDPFSIQKLTQALKRDSSQSASNVALIAAELARRKEPLEATPLDSVSMVGSFVKEGQSVALVRVDNLLYQVRVGNYLGQNYGRVTKVSETNLSLREIVQDAAGEWIERVATLQLQERPK